MEYSGKNWVERFPTSASTHDLIQPFRANVEAFIEALTAAGASVQIAATYRPAERAYLMHWCCMIADSEQDPASIPSMHGMDIDWTCGSNRILAKARAAEMKAAYRIKFPAALVSRHTQRRAIDMAVWSWSGKTISLRAKDLTGKLQTMALTEVQDLYDAGEIFGVIKLTADPPHWSDDGH